MKYYQLVYIVAYHTLFLLGVGCVKIQNLEVPALVELGSAAVLDCEYSLDDKEGLVIKWFFNDHTPIYQWIPPREPQALGILKGNVDLDFRVGDDPLSSRRALKIPEVGVELSGNYTCLVSTFRYEDRHTGSMLVYNGEHNMDLSAEFVDFSENEIEVVCMVDEVFPEPTLVLKHFLLTMANQTSNVTLEASGLYSAETRVTLNEIVLSDTEHFECELTLPAANYTAKKRITFITRVHESSSTEFYQNTTVKSAWQDLFFKRRPMLNGRRSDTPIKKFKKARYSRSYSPTS